MQLCRTMGDESESDLGVPLFVFNQDKPTVQGMAGMRQMLRPLFSGAQRFIEIFPMFNEATPQCQLQHSEIGGRLCALFQQLGKLAAQLDKAGDEFISIENAVASAPNKDQPS
jgi:hypothetical protein